MFTIPTVSDFKSFFVRDFPYGGDISESVTDGDISRAMTEAGTSINEELFGIQAEFNVAFYYLSAHNLVVNIKNSSAGISGQYEWNQTSKGVGSVSASVNIPQEISSDPLFSFLTKTTYGAKYVEILIPLLRGVMYVSEGSTRP